MPEIKKAVELSVRVVCVGSRVVCIVAEMQPPSLDDVQGVQNLNTDFIG